MNDTTPVILGGTLALFVFMAAAFAGVDRPLFLPAPVSGAHERFEAGCPACHKPWDGPAEERCLACHGRALEDETHRRERMASPAKAHVPEKLSGLGCVSCHREHHPAAVEGYTGPDGLCVMCHPPEKINEDHAKFGPGSCQESSCHSYHFNFSAREAAAAPDVRLKESSGTTPKLSPRKTPGLSQEALEKMRADYFYRRNTVAAAQYEIGRHWGTKATCRRCHETAAGFLDETPPVKVCAECHDKQTRSFGEGSHGAPAALGVERFVRPGARVGCGDCHDVHSLRLERARRSACLGCHGGPHVENYENSGHYRYLSDPVFRGKPMTGVDCAGCHMPRSMKLGGATEHNETLTVSSEKVMASMVCSRCHGLRFSLWSLFTPELAGVSFSYAPAGAAPAGVDFLFGRGG